MGERLGFRGVSRGFDTLARNGGGSTRGFLRGFLAEAQETEEEATEKLGTFSSRYTLRARVRLVGSRVRAPLC